MKNPGRDGSPGPGQESKVLGMKHTPQSEGDQAQCRDGAKPDSESGGWIVRLSADVLMRTAGLSSGALPLLIALEQTCRVDYSCFPSNRYLSEMVGCTPRQIQNVLAELEGAGWIRRVVDPENRSRAKIVMLERLDTGRPVGTSSAEEKTRKKLRTPTKKISRGRTKKTSPRTRTHAEEGHNEGVDLFRPRSQRSGVPDTLTRSAAEDAPAFKKTSSKRRPDRMTAPEMDASILEYAKVAGSNRPWSPLIEDAEPFQAPTRQPGGM
jgi:helix-turn-helix protein